MELAYYSGGWFDETHRPPPLILFEIGHSRERSAHHGGAQTDVLEVRQKRDRDGLEGHEDVTECVRADQSASQQRDTARDPPKLPSITSHTPARDSVFRVATNAM